MSKDIECPYCEAGIDINHDDGQGYEEGVAHQQQCWSCEMTFVFQTSISFDYEPSKADCLNDGEHDFKPTRTFPIEFTRMECTMCEEQRKPTESEWEQIYLSRQQS